MSLYSNDVLYNTLKELEIIDIKELDNAYALSKEQNTPLGEALTDKDLISDENLGRVIADLIQTPFINLSTVSIPEEILQVVPEVVAKKQKVIAFKKDKDGLHVAMANPTNTQMKSFIEKKVGIPVIVYLATERDLYNTTSLYNKEIKKAFDEIINESVKLAKGTTKQDVPIVKIVDTILTYAYQNRASDVHIEPYEKESFVRFRIDGILHDIIKLPIAIHSLVITRIKVLAKLRTDEHQATQDGKMQIKMPKENLDIRVSLVPSVKGETAVLRLLSEYSRQFSLTDLGISEKDLELVKSAYEKPYGMILSTGPTGSGKTTTMYAILKLLNRREVNIATIEDPVEYEIAGITQIQVNTKANLTFASGLRSIVRQDPNIILVGEIRDEETASIAINSAMTGHLVLSTLHTNDSATAIPRLSDMQVEPFLISSTVNVIIGQRLVRKICQVCRVSEEITTEELQKNVTLNFLKRHKDEDKVVRIYKGKGCPVCHQTGYEGRLGVFEVLAVTDAIRKAIVEGKDAAVIREIAIQEGMTTMLDDGWGKVKKGITTIDEIIRVIKE